MPPVISQGPPESSDRPPPASRDADLAGQMMSVPSMATVADRALVQAVQVWGVGLESSFLDRFPQGRRESLRKDLAEVPGEAAEVIKDALRRAHRAQARPDLGHVHPSWWVRALKDESPAV